jgi:hypothetical protein
MANQTIYGCYSAGSIVFEGQACDSGDYTGCYVSSGEHAGQIAVTVSEVNCDDTYYACFDSGTGKFNLSIPDDCCVVLGNCCNESTGVCTGDVLQENCADSWYGEKSCAYCGAYTCNALGCGEGNTPKYLLLTVSGFNPCPTVECFQFVGGFWNYTSLNSGNGSFKLTQVSSTYPCQYISDEFDFYLKKVWQNSGCQAPLLSEELVKVRWRVYIDTGTIVLGSWFLADDIEFSNCFTGSGENTKTGYCWEGARTDTYGGGVASVDLWVEPL